MGNKNQLELFESAPIPKAVIGNAVPSIISMLMIMIYNLADTFFIGQTQDPYMVAAVSVATPAFLIFMSIGMLFGVGGTSLISRMLGAGNGEKAKHVSSFCFWTSLAIGILGTVIILVFLDPICRIVGATEGTIGYARTYLGIVAFGVPFLVISNGFSSILRAEGKAKKAMNGVILGNMTNIILDPIMILAFHWNIAGAAIATVIGNLVAALFYIAHYFSKEALLSIKPSDYELSAKLTKAVCAIGIPASVNTIMTSVGMMVVYNFMSRHGDLSVAALGVAFKVNMIASSTMIGLGTGIQPLLGYCYGARNKERYLGVLRFSLCFAFVVGFVLMLLCYFGAEVIVRAFLDNDEVVAVGTRFARTFVISAPIIGLLYVCVNAVQSLGAGKPALLLSFCRQGIVYIPAMIILNALFHSAETLVCAAPIADYTTTFIAAIVAFITIRHYFNKVGL